MSDRTVRNWIRTAYEPIKPQGRPAHPKAARYRALVEVARQRKRQERTVGWRPVEEALRDQVPTRLVQWALRTLKARDRRRERERRRRFSHHLEILHKDVIWTQDGTHTGRWKGHKIEAEMLKDRGTLGYKAVLVGPPVSGNDVLVMLKTTKAKHGLLPLVWQRDGASWYDEKNVQAYLEKEQVLNLVNRPHQPTDNPSAENAVRELKAVTHLGKGVAIADPFDVAVLLGGSSERLNTYRLRASRGYRSAKELTQTMPAWYGVVSREEFYRKARTAMKLAVQGKNKAQARQAEREAVFATLEFFGLIKQTRGGRPFSSQQLEKVS